MQALEFPTLCYLQTPDVTFQEQLKGSIPKQTHSVRTMPHRRSSRKQFEFSSGSYSQTFSISSYSLHQLESNILEEVQKYIDYCQGWRKKQKSIKVEYENQKLPGPEPAVVLQLEVDEDELEDPVEESGELPVEASVEDEEPVEESVEDEDPATDVDGESVEPDVEVMPKMY